MLRQDEVLADEAARRGVRRKVRRFWKANRWVALTAVPAVGIAFFIARNGA